MSTVSFKQLAELINRKQARQVRKWLEDKGVLYFPDADGKPCTTERALHEAMSRGRKTSPNWNAVRRER